MACLIEGKTRDLPHLQGPGEGGDRPHSGDRPESFDPVGQQRVPAQQTHQGIFRFLQPYDGIPAELQQRSNIGMDLLVARQKFTEVAHLVQPLLAIGHSGFHQ